VEVLGPSDFGQALLAWALHEWNGRLRAHLPAEAASLSPEAAGLNAVRALLQVRRDVIAGIVAAKVVDCVRIHVTVRDIPSIRVMGADPVANFSKKKLAERDTDGSADYVRRLAASSTSVGPPILAVARSTTGLITIFDGMHRMAAWVAHVSAGREYPLEINLVLTERPSLVFELPERT
jgi:hypothetical protein